MAANASAQLAGFSCRYVPTAVVYHMGSATLGRELNDFTRYHLWRNALWILAKDLPAGAIIRHGPELAINQARNAAAAWWDGKLGLWRKAWRDAIRGLPGVLRKRRVVQARRRVTLRDLEAVIGPEAPDARERPAVATNRRSRSGRRPTRSAA